MKAGAIVGVILIVVGVIALVFGGINYKKQERVVDVGPIKIDAEKQKSIPVPPVVSVICIAAGVTLLLIKK